MILSFDTETTGLVNSREPLDHPVQPHLVQLGCIMLEPDTLKELGSLSVIVRPDGYSIPQQSTAVHGITTEMATRYGVPLVVAMAMFTNLRAIAEEAVAHNLEFDKMMMDIELRRIKAATGKEPAKGWPEKMTCTMRETSTLVGLPPTAKMRAAGFTKNKPPNLTELHTFLFGVGFEGAHGALVDCGAMVRCLRELRLVRKVLF